MSDDDEANGRHISSSFQRGLAAFERRFTRREAVPDAALAEPWFAADHASIGLLAGRNKVIEVSVTGPTRNILIGRFAGSRRRRTDEDGVAKALGVSIADSEQLLDHIEQSLRAGIDAYQETYRTLAAGERSENLASNVVRPDAAWDRIGASTRIPPRASTRTTPRPSPANITVQPTGGNFPERSAGLTL